jgi:hypothetical protein
MLVESQGEEGIWGRADMTIQPVKLKASSEDKAGGKLSWRGRTTA